MPTKVGLSICRRKQFRPDALPATTNASYGYKPGVELMLTGSKSVEARPFLQLNYPVSQKGHPTLAHNFAKC